MPPEFLCSSNISPAVCEKATDFHAQIAERIRAVCGLDNTLSRALDIGCGTGLSTVALTPLVHEVIGVDISLDILTNAKQNPRVKYFEAPAEKLRFADDDFKLATAGVVFHWFIRQEVLKESARVPRRNRWLVIDSDGGFGRMKENPEYEDWNLKHYIVRSPTPPRNTTPLTEDEADRFGFPLVSRERFHHDETFSPDNLVRFLVTQSNVIAEIEQGTNYIDDVAAWLTDQVKPLFPDPKATFGFGGSVCFLRNDAA